MKELKAWLEAEIERCNTAKSGDTLGTWQERYLYYNGKIETCLAALAEIKRMEESANNLEPTSVEWNEYNSGKCLNAIRNFRIRKECTLQEAMDAFNHKWNASIVNNK